MWEIFQKVWPCVVRPLWCWMYLSYTSYLGEEISIFGIYTLVVFDPVSGLLTEIADK